MDERQKEPAWLDALKVARFGYIDKDGLFVKIPSDYDGEVMKKYRAGEINPRWVGGQHDYENARAAWLAATPHPEESQDARRERVMEAIAEALGDAMDCTRVWSAWGVGTMRENDFVLVRDDAERLAEIADAAIDAAIAAKEAL